jgi:hypothetical protein
LHQLYSATPSKVVRALRDSVYAVPRSEATRLRNSLACHFRREALGDLRCDIIFGRYRRVLSVARAHATAREGLLLRRATREMILIGPVNPGKSLADTALRFAFRCIFLAHNLVRQRIKFVTHRRLHDAGIAEAVGTVIGRRRRRTPP